jgi:hypothetical protein
LEELGWTGEIDEFNEAALATTCQVLDFIVFVST